MEASEILGWIASITTVVYTCFGIPVQLYKNYQRKSTKGVSLAMILLLCISLLSWSTYAFVKVPRDWFILGSNFPGFLCVLGMLFQFWVYRGKDPLLTTE